MSNDRVIETTVPANLVTFTIKTGGAPIKDTYGVMSVVVHKSVNKIPTARITLSDGDAALEDFEISNTEDFTPGAEVEILAGYQSEETVIFKGIIINHGIAIRKNRSSILTVECKDVAVSMVEGKHSAYFNGMKDSAAIEEILGNYDVNGTVTATKLEHKELVQYNSTDWDFVLSRAEANGMLVIANDGDLTIDEPKTSTAPVLTLQYGDTIIEFEADVDARNQIKAATSSSWDSSEQAVVVSDGKDPKPTSPGNFKADDLAKVIGLESMDFQHSGSLTDVELKAWADAALMKSRLSKVRGRVKFEGFDKVFPGDMIELKGVGDRFNGKAFVSGVRQEIYGGTWTTDVQFGLSPEWFTKEQEISETPASGLLPSIAGLSTGVVTKIDEDPDGEDRVQVKIPLIDNDADGVWARVATPDAGDGRGIFFRPEIDDEVILGFLNDDPRNAVVLGMLNSSAKPAPLVATDTNDEKGIVTRSETKFIINDEDVSLTISTPAGNQIVLSEAEESILIEDQNGNKIEMSADGILIESAADLILKASGDVTVEGTNIEMAASAELKADGGAGSELTSGAIVKVEGSLVQIN